MFQSKSPAAPPSSCLNIGLVNKTDKQIVLHWTRPKVTGRNDFYYVISYDNGDSKGEHTLQGSSDLDRVVEVISGLTPATTYTVTVTVRNGVSEQDGGNEHLRRCQLRTTTEEGSKFD